MTIGGTRNPRRATEGSQWAHVGPSLITSTSRRNTLLVARVSFPELFAKY